MGPINLTVKIQVFNCKMRHFAVKFIVKCVFTVKCSAISQLSKLATRGH